MATLVRRIEINSKVNVSMLTLKWGEVLSTLLPGSLAIMALAPFFPWLERQVTSVGAVGVGNGVALLMASVLAGGALEALTRITWEKYLIWRCPSPGVLQHLRPDNLELYERGVQSSYKYVTFYSNFGWALVLLFGSRIATGKTQGRPGVGTLLTLLAAAVLFCASAVQWKYFTNYMAKVIKPKE